MSNFIFNIHSGLFVCVCRILKRLCRHVKFYPMYSHMHAKVEHSTVRALTKQYQMGIRPRQEKYVGFQWYGLSKCFFPGFFSIVTKSGLDFT